MKMLVGQEEWVTAHFVVEMSVLAGSDPTAIADWVQASLELSCDDDEDGYFASLGIRSINGTEFRR